MIWIFKNLQQYRKIRGFIFFMGIIRISHPIPLLSFSAFWFSLDGRSPVSCRNPLPMTLPMPLKSCKILEKITQNFTFAFFPSSMNSSFRWPIDFTDSMRSCFIFCAFLCIDSATMSMLTYKKMRKFFIIKLFFKFTPSTVSFQQSSKI